jgi:protein-serine/threonine kinase
MEFCDGGDLYHLVTSRRKLATYEADCFFKQLMRGINYMHKEGVAHRNIKPENLILTHQGSLKIIDFGNAECFRAPWEQHPHFTRRLSGTIPYIAPEEFIHEEFDPRAVDVWAAGITYIAMRIGRLPWRTAMKDEDELYAEYLEGRRQATGYEPIQSLHRVCLCLNKIRHYPFWFCPV